MLFQEFLQFFFSSQFSLITESSHSNIMLPLVQHTGYEEILNSLCRTDFTLYLEVGYDINMALVWRQIPMLLTILGTYLHILLNPNWTLVTGL